MHDDPAPTKLLLGASGDPWAESSGSLMRERFSDLLFDRATWRRPVRFVSPRIRISLWRAFDGRDHEVRRQTVARTRRRCCPVEQAGAIFVEGPEAVASTLIQFGLVRSLPILLYRWEGQTDDPSVAWWPVGPEVMSISLLLVRLKREPLKYAAKRFWELAENRVCQRRDLFVRVTAPASSAIQLGGVVRRNSRQANPRPLAGLDVGSARQPVSLVQLLAGGDPPGGA